MEQMGGASWRSRQPYRAMLKPEKRDSLSLEIQKKLTQYHELSMVARHNSLIKNSKQIISGDLPARMKMLSEDNSKIIGAEQRVQTVRRKKSSKK
jgi:hypothetical protein